MSSARFVRRGEKIREGGLAASVIWTRAAVESETDFLTDSVDKGPGMRRPVLGRIDASALFRMKHPGCQQARCHTDDHLKSSLLGSIDARHYKRFIMDRSSQVPTNPYHTNDRQI